MPFYVYVHAGLMYVHRYAPAHRVYMSYTFTHPNKMITVELACSVSVGPIYPFFTYSVSKYIHNHFASIVSNCDSSIISTGIFF